MVDIVIDLETLGTRPGCSILEIGACAVDGKTGEITANFSRLVSGTYCHADVRRVAEGKDCLGGIDSATASWWTMDAGRDETLRRILSRTYSPSSDIDALLAFTEWCGAVREFSEARVWGNGPTFDLAILAHAYDREHIPCPWYHYEERCVRTALEQANYERGSLGWIERGPRHRALNDARHEARKLFYSGALGEVSAIIRRLHQRGVVKGNPVRAETMTWMCMDCGHKWTDLTECAAVFRSGCPACGSKRILDCNLSGTPVRLEMAQTVGEGR